MKWDLLDLLSAAGQAADSAAGDWEGASYAYALDELGRNLRELRDRHRSGDSTVVDEFFSVYVIDDKG